MSKMGKYLYCFIMEKEIVTLGNSQINNLNAPIYTIPYKNIAAVVSDAPIVEYATTRNNILAHQKVVSKIMETYTVVPVSFGTIAPNKKKTEYIIEENYEDFEEAILKLKDRVELGLRITWNENYFNTDVETEEIIELKNEISRKSVDTTLIDKITLGQMVEASILSKREEYIASIYDELEKIAVEGKISDKIAIKTVFNAYFLVDKIREQEFDMKVEEIAERFKGKLDFSYTGPWPPYNFVAINIHIK